MAQPTKTAPKQAPKETVSDDKKTISLEYLNQQIVALQKENKALRAELDKVATGADQMVVALNNRLDSTQSDLEQVKALQPKKVRAVRITREHIFPMTEAPDANQDGELSLAEVLEFARKKGPSWAGEKIGILAEYDY